MKKKNVTTRLSVLRVFVAGRRLYPALSICAMALVTLIIGLHAVLADVPGPGDITIHVRTYPTGADLPGASVSISCTGGALTTLGGVTDISGNISATAVELGTAYVAASCDDTDSIDMIAALDGYTTAESIVSLYYTSEANSYGPVEMPYSHRVELIRTSDSGFVEGAAVSIGATPCEADGVYYYCPVPLASDGGVDEIVAMNGPITVYATSGDRTLATDAMIQNIVSYDDVVPTVTLVGDNVAVYQFISTCPSVACDRGDIYGTVLNFSETLSNDSKAAVEAAITASADVVPRTYVWNGTRVRVYATEPVSFFDDVVADVTDLVGNTSYGLLLIDSDDTAPTIGTIAALLQNGDPASVNANNWYYYSIDQSIKFTVASDTELPVFKACVKSLTNANPTSTCSFIGPENDYETGTLGVDYVNAVSATEFEGVWTYLFNIPLLDYGIPPTQGGYPISLYLIDMSGNVTYSTSQETSFGAVFGINPSTVAPLDNATTTDWSTIDDFTSVSPLVFSAQVGETELGRISLNGPLNLTAQATIDALMNLSTYVTVNGDVIRIDSEGLAAFDGGASLLMHVETGGVQPGLTVKNNDGEILGSVSNSTCLGDCEPLEFGGDTLGNFGWDEINGNLTFTTTGFSEFDTDYTAPEVAWARITGPSTIKIGYSEAVNTVAEDYVDDTFGGALAGDANNCSVSSVDNSGTDVVTLNLSCDISLDPGSVGTMDIPATVTDIVGNAFIPITAQEVVDGQTPIINVYVDDSFTGTSDAGGHLWGIDAFDTVQEGIDAVADGGTVNVAAGIYDEEIDINTSLTLEGDPGDEGAGPGEGAPIINDTYCDTRTININANDVTIEGFSMTSECNYPSIRVSDGISGAQILDNEIANNYTGIGLSPYSTSSTVMRNLLHDNYYGITIGGSQNNTISDNEVYDNSGSGVYFKCGGGGSCDFSDGTVVSDNNIHDNTNAGVEFASWIEAPTIPVLIQSNTIDSNGCYGVYIDIDVIGISILNNDITNNGLTCEFTGIYANSVSQVVVHGNTISGNDDGVINNSEGDTLDATRNYWGAPDGPSGEGLGGGDSIDTMIDYEPFYTDAALTLFSNTTAIPVSDLNPLEINTDDTDEEEDSLDVADLLTDIGDGVLEGEIPEITINSTTDLGDVTVEIPAGTTVTGGEGWTGIIHAPTVKANNSVTVSGGTVVSVIEIGFDDIELTFDKAVNIYIEGQAGKRVGYSHDGPVTEITADCPDNTFASNDPYLDGTPNDCSIDVGGDLSVWTNHFSSFVTYTTSSGGGGGSGYVPISLLTLNNPAPELISAPDVTFIYFDPSRKSDLLVQLKKVANQVCEDKYLPLVKADASEFGLSIAQANVDEAVNFICYAIDTYTDKLGAGERRAQLRDYFQTFKRSDVDWDDVVRNAQGIKPVHRNLAEEQKQVGVALGIFKKIFNVNAPNFKDAKEDLAWNTILYRIRFPRDLTLEKQGITEFRIIYGRAPKSPQDWAVVRVLGYILK